MGTLANWPVFTESNVGDAQIEARPCADLCARLDGSRILWR